MATNRGPHDRSDSDNVSETIEESKEADTVIVVNDYIETIDSETNQDIEEKEDGE